MPPETTKNDDTDEVSGTSIASENIELLSRAKIRSDVAKRVRSDNDTDIIYCDIDQNIKEIRAILTTNKEIHLRCMESSEKSSYSTFVRYAFDLVETYTIDSKSQFVTYPDKLVKVFDMTPLSKLPAGIDDIFVPNRKPFGKLIDFEALFEKSLILHDDVLGPFLEILKEHLLSSVQVCLGEIETWLMESGSHINYLESTFGVKLEFPGENEILTNYCSCPEGTHPDSLLCCGCGKSFNTHGGSDHRCSTGYGHCFKCKKFNLLKSCSLPGTLEMKFDISKLHERKRLEKVLELMEMGEDEDTSNDKISEFI